MSDIQPAIFAILDGQLSRHGEIPIIAGNLILDVIENEEGGWKYTDHKDDPDQGTFAGVRYITWKQWLGSRDASLRVELHDFVAFVNTYSNHQDIIFLIYWDLYARPCSLELYDPKMGKAVLSAAINSGIHTAAKTVQRAVNSCTKTGVYFGELKLDGNIGPKSQSAIGTCASDDLLGWYLYYWRQFYAVLVFENAKAWKEWGEKAQEMATHRGKYTNTAVANHEALKPSYLRATFLNGWLNRIEKTQGRKV